MFLSCTSPFLLQIASNTSWECVWRCVSIRCWTPGNSLQRYSSPVGWSTFDDAPLFSRMLTRSLWPVRTVRQKFTKSLSKVSKSKQLFICGVQHRSDTAPFFEVIHFCLVQQWLNYSKVCGGTQHCLPSLCLPPLISFSFPFPPLRSKLP